GEARAFVTSARIALPIGVRARDDVGRWASSIRVSPSAPSPGLPAALASSRWQLHGGLRTNLLVPLGRDAPGARTRPRLLPPRRTSASAVSWQRAACRRQALLLKG